MLIASTPSARKASRAGQGGTDSRWSNAPETAGRWASYRSGRGASVRDRPGARTTSPAAASSARPAHFQSPAQALTSSRHGCIRVRTLAFELISRPSPVAGEANPTVDLSTARTALPTPWPPNHAAHQAGFQMAIPPVAAAASRRSLGWAIELALGHRSPRPPPHPLRVVPTLSNTHQEHQKREHYLCWLRVSPSAHGVETK